jgi:hemoglobin
VSVGRPVASLAGRDVTRDIEGVEDLEELVRAFYRDVAMDDVLGPVFSAAGVDWSAHIPKLVDFWTWQLFGERVYVGQPMQAHVGAHRRTPFADRHYERWLDLFTVTVDDRFAGPVAELAKARAHKVASSMRRFLAG